MWPMLSLTLECGNSTVGSKAALALRIRVNISEMGSVIILPTGFGDARNQAIEGRFPESHARAIELAQVAMAPSAHGASVHEPCGTRVARQFGQRGIIALGLQFRPQRGKFLHRGRLALVALQPCLFRHKFISPRRACPAPSTTRRPRHRSWPR